MSAQEATTGSNRQQASVQQMVDKIVELQDKLVEAQEKNLVLSMQLREMEMMVRDGDDLKSELENHSALLADKSRENKQLHQDFARVTTALEEKLKEIEELKVSNNDLNQQLKQRESERDLLAVMLREHEQGQRQTDSFEEDKKQKGWLDRFKGG